MVKEIPVKYLDNTLTTLVDDEDYPLLSRHNWYALVSESDNGYYAYAPLHIGKGKRKMIPMTHVIMGSGYHVDHADLNSLNNQKYNLRPATHQQNGWNKGKSRLCHGGTPPTSKYKGLSYRPLKGISRWLVQIKHVEEGQHKDTGTVIRVGYFWDEDEAARAYNRKVVELRGKWAWQNPVPENQPNQQSI